MTTGSVSQSGAETLFKVIPGHEVSQSGAEYLHRVLPGHAVSQVGAELLYKAVPCTTRWAQAWTITRVDGTVYRFTSLDRDLDWLGATFRACDSLQPSASEGVSEVDAAGSMDLSGAIGAGGMSELALFAGLFDGATCEAWLLPWDAAAQAKGGARLLLRGNFGAVEHGATGFKVDLVGDGARLMQTPLVRSLQPGCRWLFGDSNCQKDLAPLTVTGTVTSGDGQRAFTDSGRAEVAGYFARGRVTFTTGLNAGISAEIKDHDAGGAFTLWPRLAFPIVLGDEYSMTPGCTNLKTSANGTNGCDAWANYVNYGGFLDVPGGDKRSKAAVVRSAG